MHDALSFRSFGLLIAWAVGGLGALHAQEPLHQVQAVVTGVHTAQQAQHADRALLELEGVRMSRTDVNTANLFLLVRADSPVNETLVGQALAPSGIRVHCWVRKPRSDAPIRPLDPAQCLADPATR